jgi:hypothetical protein
MPEVGNMGLPKKLLDRGVTDLVRISDGRMSGTGFGTVVLHASPEAACGGNFSVVQTLCGLVHPACGAGAPWCRYGLPERCIRQ